jgi:hypothetical protein
VRAVQVVRDSLDFYPGNIDRSIYPGIIAPVMTLERTYTAFAGDQIIISGALNPMLLRVKECLDAGEPRPVLIFEDQTGIQVDFDFSGTPEQVLVRLPSHPLFARSEATPRVPTGPGRPRLGVVSREVSLLPRHWEWLEQQPGGISGALRRLVEEARKRMPGKERARLIREAASKFMWAMAGNLPGFEEASRALFAKNGERLQALMSNWPEDIRGHVQRLLAESVALEQDAAG